MIAYRCRTLVTMDGTPIENGAFVVDGSRFVKAGRATEILADHPGQVVDLGEVAAMPGLINAHCHLDYTLMRGAILPAKSFSRWVKRINALKRSFTDNDYLRATQLGFEELRKNGVTTVLNIVSTPQIFPLLAPPQIRAWFFLELIDVRPRPWIEEHVFGSWLFLSGNGERLGGFGLSPHAPYTASAKMYEVALECSHSLNLLITTHIAESSEEYAMFAEGSGELHEFLSQLGRPMTDCGSTSPLRYLIENGLIDQDCNDSLNLFSEMRTAKKFYPTLGARELVEMVTIRPARALKLARELGRIGPGYLADAIAVPFKGPTSDVFEAIIQHRGAIKWMMVNGQILK